MAQQQLSTNTFGCAKWIVSSDATQGTHTTIGAALTSASSGDTIFIRPGTYTENLTLKAGVNLTAFGSDSSQNQTGHVIISGNCTFTGTGSVSISGIQLQTNSAALLTVSGSNASIVNLENCNLNCSNNTGITFSASNTSATINIKNCTGDIGTTGIALFSFSSTGSLNFFDSNFTNSGASTTSSTCSAGILNLFFSKFLSPITTSSTGGIGIQLSNIDTSAQNTTSLTVGGSGSSTAYQSFFSAGSASAISISSTFGCYLCNISSTNTNAITGAGAISYSGLSFSTTSKTINTTTQTVSGTLFGSTNTAPTAGMLGEIISNSATSVSTSNNTPVTITSINVTAGVWDITAMSSSIPTGGSGLMNAVQMGISTTNNTLPSGNSGVDFTQNNTTSAVLLPAVVLPLRVVVSATTTYYLVVNNVYSASTCPTNGKIRAVRVG